MNTLYIALLSIILSVAAQFSLKTGMTSHAVKEVLSMPYSLRTIQVIIFDKHIFTGFFLYGLGAIVWLAVLAKWDVSKAYPLVGLGFVLTLFVGNFLGETISLTRSIGVCFVIFGVILVSRT